MISKHSRLPWQTALLARRGLPRRPSPITRRNASYKMPYLAHEKIYEAEGLNPVFTREGFAYAWTHYQGYLLYTLNQLIDETPDMLNLILKYARSAQHAHIFNFASMAHNNDFFFQGMSPNPPPMPPDLVGYIENSFSSVESLRSTFIATADAMFGPGFVWLVKKPDNDLAILTTYIAGTPYPGANFRRQPVDMNNVTTSILPNAYAAQTHKHNESVKNVVQNYAGYAGSFGVASELAPQLGPGGADIEPLLAVSTWEHTFLPDYGSWGKREFLERWWEKIDWDVVHNRTRWKLGAKSSRSIGLSW